MSDTTPPKAIIVLRNRSVLMVVQRYCNINLRLVRFVLAERWSSGMKLGRIRRYNPRRCARCDAVTAVRCAQVRCPMLNPPTKEKLV